MTVPERLLRRGEVARPDGRSGPIAVLSIWRESARRQVRVARVWIGSDSVSAPATLCENLLRWFPTLGGRRPESTIEGYLATWVTSVGDTPSSWIDRLIQAGYLIRYQRLAQDQISPAGPPELCLGNRGEALLTAHRSQLDARVQAFVAEVTEEIRALPTQGAHAGYDAVLGGLLNAANALDKGEAVRLPGIEGTAAQVHIQGALRFLTAAAARMAAAGPYDWKEIGALYHPRIDASKQFDAQQERNLALLEELTGVPLEACGLVSLGSLYSVFYAGRLHYRCGDAEYTGRPGRVLSLTSDELEELEVLECPDRLIITENRSFLLKAAHSRWVEEKDVLVIGMDGQPRSGFRRLLRLLGVAPVVWVDADGAGLVMARTLESEGLDARWVLPPLSIEPASELGTYAAWQERMTHRLARDEVEQEAIMGGPSTWRFLLT